MYILICYIILLYYFCIFLCIQYLSLSYQVFIFGVFQREAQVEALQLLQHLLVSVFLFSIAYFHLYVYIQVFVLLSCGFFVCYFYFLLSSSRSTFLFPYYLAYIILLCLFMYYLAYDIIYISKFPSFMFLCFNFIMCCLS